MFVTTSNSSWVLFLQKLILLVVGSVITYFMSGHLLTLQQQNPEQDGGPPLRKQDRARFDEIVQALSLCPKTVDSLNDYEKHLLIANVVLPEKVRDTYDNVVGLERQVELLRRLVVRPTTVATIEAPSLRTVNGILLHGVPGTGKTLLARATAKALDCPFLNFDITSVEDKYVGESNRRLRAVFTLARKMRNCVIFFDEFDGVANKRNYTLDQNHVNSLKTELLRQMDGVVVEEEEELTEADPAHGGKRRLILMAATNNLCNIDKAFLRRLRLHVHVPLPDSAAIAEILRRKLRSSDFEPDADLLRHCEATLMSGSDLTQLCVLAEHEAAASSAQTVNQAHVRAALELLVPPPPTPPSSATTERASSTFKASATNNQAK